MNMRVRAQLYQDFINQYKSFHSSTVKNKETLYANAQAEWNLLKTDEDKLKNKIQEYASRSMRHKSTLLKYWGTVTLKPTADDTSNPSILLASSSSTHAASSSPSELSNDASSILPVIGDLEKEQSTTTNFKAPVQVKITQEINDTSEKLTKLYSLKSSGLITNDSANSINELEKKKKKLESKLHVLKHDQQRKRTKRSDFKTVIHQLVDKYPDVADTLKRFKRVDPFRPKLEVDQPALLETIIDIASSSAAADNRRQTDLLRSIKTLDDLSEELLNRGFSISRSATYLRLIPRRSNTSEGKIILQSRSILCKNSFVILAYSLLR